MEDPGEDCPPWARWLGKILQPQPSRAPPHVNPVQLTKPQVYDGKDLSKFRPWWYKVQAYLQTYKDSFEDDQTKINWVGSLLMDKAQVFHQHRVRQLESLKVADTWAAYKHALLERFRDPSEPSRNYDKMTALEYKGDTVQYIIELLDLNETVHLSGEALKKLVIRALPKGIIRMVYSKASGIPDSDEDFLASVREAGRMHEEMESKLSSAGKEKPASKPEPPRAGKRKENKGSPSGQSSRGEDKKAGGSQPKWNSVREALNGVPQAKIDKRRKAKVSCWRCGRDNHSTLNCFANKDSDGNDIEAPSKVSALSAPLNLGGTPAPILKRPRTKEEDDGDTPLPPDKIARIAGLMTDPPVEEIVELSPSPSGSDFY